MLITPIYAAILAIIYVALSFNVIRMRIKLKIPFGDGKDKQLKRAMRVHGNFSEYVPLAIILLYFLELHSQNNLLIHSLGSAFLIARLCHIFGVSQIKERIAFRVFGLFITGGVLCICASTILLSDSIN